MGPHAIEHGKESWGKGTYQTAQDKDLGRFQVSSTLTLASFVYYSLFYVAFYSYSYLGAGAGAVECKGSGRGVLLGLRVSGRHVEAGDAEVAVRGIPVRG